MEAKTIHASLRHVGTYPSQQQTTNNFLKINLYSYRPTVLWNVFAEREIRLKYNIFDTHIQQPISRLSRGRTVNKFIIIIIIIIYILYILIVRVFLNRTSF